MADAGDRERENSAKLRRPPLTVSALRAGMRAAVAVSGGADSVALLRLLAEERDRLGLILSVAHVHHGIRGEDADADAAFVEALAGELGLPFLRRDVDTPAKAQAAGLGLEETARSLRYGWFYELLATGAADTIATAHTLNDQAETVLHRLIRGAWTEGLGGISPILREPGTGTAGRGLIVRPLLGATRSQVLAWLAAIGQGWREDRTNADLAYTRNRIRHTLLPELATYNPAIATQLARTAALAREDEAFWEAEVERLLPGLLLPGTPVRGGGRASSTVPGEKTLAIEVERLRNHPPALVRRLLRGAVATLGVTLDFEQTRRLYLLVSPADLDEAPSPRRHAGSHGRREELTPALRAERTPREVRLVFSGQCEQRGPGLADASDAPAEPAPVAFKIPGQGSGFGWRLRCSLLPGAAPAAHLTATLRAARPGDRVRLRWGRGAPKRAKEVLDRIGVAASRRAAWPVLEVGGEIVWMAGAVLEPGAASQALLIEAEQVS